MNMYVMVDIGVVLAEYISIDIISTKMDWCHIDFGDCSGELWIIIVA